ACARGAIEIEARGAAEPREINGRLVGRHPQPSVDARRPNARYGLRRPEGLGGIACARLPAAYIGFRDSAIAPLGQIVDAEDAGARCYAPKKPKCHRTCKSKSHWKGAVYVALRGMAIVTQSLHLLRFFTNGRASRLRGAILTWRDP